MKARGFAIPGWTNLAITAAQLAALPAILWAAGQAREAWAIALLALAYAVVMNSAYGMLHEAEHNLLHPDKRVNHGAGVLLALFFPAPYHVLRQGHIGHHIRNRSDDDAFDLYFEGENRLWKCVQLYGTLTGLFWVLIACSNFVAVLRPGLLAPRRAAFNRPAQAFLESLNPKYHVLIRAEALAAIALHAAMIYFWRIPLASYLAVMFAFGFLWSAMQYAHHYGTERDVRRGAMNLKTFALLDLALLNHNWHRNHHMHPTVPWKYLPLLCDPGEPRGSLVAAYLREWRGPRFSTERVENRHAGKIVN